MTAATSGYDPYGNLFYDPTAALTINTPIMITTSNTTQAWPNNLNIQAGTAVPANWLANPNVLSTAQIYYNQPYYYGLDPNQAGLTQEVLDSLFEKMVTTVKPGEKFIVCLDHDVTTTQQNEMVEALNDRGLEGIVMRSARAGTGFAGNPQAFTQEEGRVDILARIGELWALAPELKLTSLLEWWQGQEMDDADFAAAVETHFMKVTNGVRGKP
jgi:hypothetical protein